ncbi:hypothetical protein [Rodentibacter pneumotropicus]|nr:hypothetical protein [Rodentibacter pneumotropicus]
MLESTDIKDYVKISTLSTESHTKLDYWSTLMVAQTHYTIDKNMKLLIKIDNSAPKPNSLFNSKRLAISQSLSPVTKLKPNQNRPHF